MRRVRIGAGLLLCMLCLNRIPVFSASRSLVLAIYEEPPYQFVDSSGAIDGLLIDLFDAVADLAGYQAEYRRYASMRDCVATLERQEVDLILGMSGANSFLLSETAELYTSPLVIVGNTNYINQHQPDRRSQFTAGYGYHATEKEIIYSLGADRYIISDRTYGLVGLLAEGKIDVAVLDQAVLDYALAGGVSGAGYSGHQQLSGHSEVYGSLHSGGQLPAAGTEHRNFRPAHRRQLRRDQISVDPGTNGDRLEGPAVLCIGRNGADAGHFWRLLLYQPAHPPSVGGRACGKDTGHPQRQPAVGEPSQTYAV